MLYLQSCNSILEEDACAFCFKVDAGLQLNEAVVNFLQIQLFLLDLIVSLKAGENAPVQADSNHRIAIPCVFSNAIGREVAKSGICLKDASNVVRLRVHP